MILKSKQLITALEEYYNSLNSNRYENKIIINYTVADDKHVVKVLMEIYAKYILHKELTVVEKEDEVYYEEEKLKYMCGVRGEVPELDIHHHLIRIVNHIENGEILFKEIPSNGSDKFRWKTIKVSNLDPTLENVIDTIINGKITLFYGNRNRPSLPMTDLVPYFTKQLDNKGISYIVNDAYYPDNGIVVVSSIENKEVPEHIYYKPSSSTQGMFIDFAQHTHFNLFFIQDTFNYEKIFNYAENIYLVKPDAFLCKHTMKSFGSVEALPRIAKLMSIV